MAKNRRADFYCASSVSWTVVGGLSLAWAVLGAWVAAASPYRCETNEGCYHDFDEWAVEAKARFGASVLRLDMTASGVAMAQEVNAPPSHNNFPLCGGSVCRLTFWSEDTGLPASVELLPLQFGGGASPTAYGLTWNDEEGDPIPSFQNAVSIGDINNWEDDDVLFKMLDGVPVYAFGFHLNDNAAAPSELLIARLADGTELGFFMDEAESSGGKIFVGVVADAPIVEVEFLEGNGGDDVAVGSLMLGITPGSDRQLMRRQLAGFSDGFGSSVGLSDGWLAILDNFSSTGRVVLYTRDARGLWAERQIVSGLLLTEIVLQGNTLAVGSAGMPGEGGEVLIFERQGNTWSLAQTLHAPSGSEIGQHVALDGELLATTSNFSELVTVFERNAVGDWQHSASLAQPLTSPIFDLEIRDGTVVATAEPFQPQVWIWERDRGGADAWGVALDLLFVNEVEFRAISLRDGKLLLATPDSVVRLDRTAGPQGDWVVQASIDSELPAGELRDVLLTEDGRLFIGMESDDLASGGGMVYEVSQTQLEGAWSVVPLPLHTSAEGAALGSDLSYGDHTLAIGGGTRAYSLRFSGIFSDGFEGGSLSAWSSAVP